MMRAVVFIAMGLITVGIVCGAGFALIPALLGFDAAAAVALVMILYDSLAVVMPAALWAALYLRRDDKEYRSAYAGMGCAVTTALQGAILGSLLGAGPVFLTIAPMAAGVGANVDPNVFADLLYTRVVWAGLLFVAAVTIGSAVPLGIWTYFTGPGRND